MARKNGFLKKMGESLSVVTNEKYGDELNDIKSRFAGIKEDLKERVEDTGLIDAFYDVTGKNPLGEKEEPSAEAEQFESNEKKEKQIPEAMFMSNSIPNVESPRTQESQFDEYSKQIERVKKLKDLKDLGILTEEEFEAKKKDVLGL